MTLDPRLNAYRSDLADVRLEGLVEAARFVEGRPGRVVAPSAPIRREPHADAALDTEALFGESVTLFEERADGWSWVQLHTDGYVGWTPAAALASPGGAATHRIRALRTPLYPGPNLKLPPWAILSFGSRLAVSAVHERFAETPEGYVFAPHLAEFSSVEPDWVATALRFVGTTYIWGGRTSIGLDCSALVQLALAGSGIECPRDSDMQAARAGTALESWELENLQRGDLVFWRGHVAIALGDGTMLHANGHHMDTVIEPLLPAVERIAGAGFDVTGVRRV